MRIAFKSYLPFVVTSVLAVACGDLDGGGEDPIDTLESNVTIDTNATYTIVGAQSNKCVEVAGASTAKSAALQIAACKDAKSQQFRAEPMSGFYRLRNVNSNMCLDVFGASKADGVKITQYPCGNQTNQQFSITDVGAGAVRITARHSGKVLDVQGAKTADGTPIVQWPSNGGKNQQFILKAAGQSPVAAKALGIIFSDADPPVWRDRAEIGPFQSKGDVFTNSPGDWDRLKGEVASFDTKTKNGSLSAYVWKGAAGSGVVTKVDAIINGDKSVLHAVGDVMAAAFVDYVEGTTTRKKKLHDFFVQQIAQPRADLGDRDIWQIEKLSDFCWQVYEWQTVVLLAYDFTPKDAFTAAERQAIEDWFHRSGTAMSTDLAREFEQVIDKTTRGGPLEQYKLINGGQNVETRLLRYQGPRYGTLQKVYNNRRASQARFVGYTGVLTEDPALTKQAQLWVKELLAFFFYEDGTLGELYRNESGSENSGLYYSANTFLSALDIAHSQAVNGDDSLYKFSTKANPKFTPKTGGGFVQGVGVGSTEKSLRWAIDQFVNYEDGTFKYYFDGDTTPTHKLIMGPNNHIQYMNFAVANHYFRDPELDLFVTGRLPGQTPFQANPAANGPFPIWAGQAHSVPGTLFLYGLRAK